MREFRSRRPVRGYGRQRVGAEKPEPAIFHFALAALHAVPETAVMVGNSLRRDCEGARRVGMGFPSIAPKTSRRPNTAAPRTGTSSLL